jgi:hypothetical protein
MAVHFPFVAEPGKMVIASAKQSPLDAAGQSLTRQAPRPAAGATQVLRATRPSAPGDAEAMQIKTTAFVLVVEKYRLSGCVAEQA